MWLAQGPVNQGFEELDRAQGDTNNDILLRGEARPDIIYQTLFAMGIELRAPSEMIYGIWACMTSFYWSIL